MCRDLRKDLFLFILQAINVSPVQGPRDLVVDSHEYKTNCCDEDEADGREADQEGQDHLRLLRPVVQSERLEEILRVSVRLALEPVHPLLGRALEATRHAELLLDPALHVRIEHLRLLLVIIAAQVVQECVLRELYALPLILPDLLLFEQEERRQVKLSACLEDSADPRLKLAVSDRDLKLSMCHSGKLRELALEFKVLGC